MKGVSPDRIRNFVIAGHAGCGKTTLSDRLLFKAGAVSRAGSVADGSSVSDFRAEEQERRCSIYASPLHCSWKDHHYFFVDTPGYADFFGETKLAIRSADLVLIVVDAATGIDMGTIRAWKTARQFGIPRAIFINGMDKEQASFANVLGALQKTFGASVCVPVVVPVGEKASFSGVAAVLGGAVPAALSESVELYRTALMDTIAESDEALMNKYLEGEKLTEAEVAKGLTQAVLSGGIVPVLAGSAGQDIGIAELLDAAITFFPKPNAGRTVTLAEGELVCNGEGDGAAFVFKSVNDPFVGQLAYLRVFTGVFRSDSEAFNTANGSKERIGSLLYVNGKEQSATEEAGPGEIVALAKLKNTRLMDTLATRANGRRFAHLDFPPPTMSYAVFAVKQGEDEKIGTGLTRLAEEDPTLKMERNAETRETVLSGLGDQHVQNVIHRLKSLFKVEVELKVPKVPYRETITSTGSCPYRHKKQTGGRGQFAEVHLRLEPLPTAEFEFANEVVGGNIPRNFIPAVEKGVVEAMIDGPLAGCKVINVKAVVYDGKYHDVDSSELAFKIAARGAFRGAMKLARAILLEPIMTLKIVFPEEYMGAITGDLNSRRGRILGMDREESLQVLNAEIPLAEVFTYSNQLRSMTQGRGTFEMAFERYDPVPTNVAQQIQAERARKTEEEE